MKDKKKFLIGAAVIAGSYMLGRSAGVIDCIISVDKELSKMYKLNISKAVWRPFKKGVKIALSQIEDKT